MTLSDTCCGSPLQVIALSALVDLVRCRACGRSSWQVDGQIAEQAAALGALSDAFPPGTAPVRPRSGHTPPRGGRPRPAPTAADARTLLSGWQVHGSSPA